MDQVVKNALIQSTLVMISTNLEMNIQRKHRTLHNEEDKMTFLLDMHHTLFPPYIRNAFSAQEKGEQLHPFIELIELYTEIWKAVDIDKLCPIIPNPENQNKN